MKFLITHFYTFENAGDAAILQKMVARLKQAVPDLSFTVLTSQSQQTTPESRTEFALLPSLFFYCVYAKSVIPRLVRAAYILVMSTLWGLLIRWLGLDIQMVLPKMVRPALAEYKSADLIVAVGGGYINAKNNWHGTATLILQLHSLILGSLLQKRVVLFSQSIGPFGNRLQTIIVKLVLDRMTAIFVREDLSLVTLKSLSITRPYIEKSGDVALAKEAATKVLSTNPPEHIKINKPTVGITARQWLPRAKQNEYEAALALLGEHIVEKYGYDVVYIPQVTASAQNDDDRWVINRIAGHVKNKTGIRFVQAGLKLEQLQHLYGLMEYVVGTRMHSLIFALNQNIPCLAIAYEPKTRGIMHDLGLSEWVIDIEKVNFNNLSEMFARLVQSRVSYRATLVSKLDDYQLLVNRPFEYIKYHYAYDR